MKEAVKSKLMERVSRSFKLKDFTVTKSTDEQILERQAVGVLSHVEEVTDLAENVLQVMVNHGLCIKITSGYRCAELNERVGGVESSQHRKGMAADFITDNKNKALRTILLNTIFDQVVLYDNFIHVSFNRGQNRGQVIKATGQKVKWLDERNLNYVGKRYCRNI